MQEMKAGGAQSENMKKPRDVTITMPMMTLNHNFINITSVLSLLLVWLNLIFSH